MPEMPNSYISIPYNNVDFVISGDYVLETRPCSLTECNLDSIDWSLSKKIDFSSSQIPFIPFDLIADVRLIDTSEIAGMSLYDLETEFLSKKLIQDALAWE